MLVFNRPAFKSGILKVVEPDNSEGHAEGAVLTYTFKPSDKGQSFAFADESYVVAHYPVLFTVAP